ncbi:MAG: RNA methyltransferase [Candidatus Marsarchaeota archaeon]|nr:RNA methyltransferase [Candidatus Marsarchaeota archaeon]
MGIKVVLVEPLYQINLGYIARAMGNFGMEKIYMVKPRCKIDGKDVKKYSKHAYDLIKNATVYDNINDAIKGSDLVVGTTGLWYKSDKSFFNVYSPEQARKMVEGKRRPVLLIGRDDIGLTKHELELCDLVVFIRTSDKYSVLNISHALSIMLYEFSKSNKNEQLDGLYADKESLERMFGLFWDSIKDKGYIRDKKAVFMAFKRMMRRANPTKRELSALSIGFKKQKKQK